MEKEVYLTKEGLEKLKEELDNLKNVKRKDVIRRIQEAKAYGDLSENAEYENAKNEQSFIEGRITEIERMLKKAKVINHAKGNIVSLGSSVLVEIEDQQHEYQIVGSSEANPSERKISNESPLGQAILGHKIGDEIEVETPDGIVKYRLKSIK